MLDGELWQILSVKSDSGFLILAMDQGVTWAEDLVTKAGSSLEEVGAAVLTQKKNNITDPSSLKALARQQQPALLQISSDIRIAFEESAQSLEDDDDDDEGF